MVTIEDIKDKYWFEGFENNLIELRGITVEDWLNVSTEIPTIAHAIEMGFLGCDSKEGNEYWENIYNEEANGI